MSVKGTTSPSTGVSTAVLAAGARHKEVPLLGLGSGHRGTLARTKGPGDGGESGEAQDTRQLFWRNG